jgi:membrane-associated protein
VTWLEDTILRLAAPLVLVVVFTLPALEASTLLGIVVPGELALVLVGVLAHQGRVPLWAAVVAGAGGAVVGDSLGYAVGRRVGERLLARIPRRLVQPSQVERATALLRRLGGRAVFVGRFPAALRALVPGLAGTARMPYGTFLAWNLAGGVLWATGSVLLASPPVRPGARPSASPAAPAWSCWACSSPARPRPCCSAGAAPAATAGPHPKGRVGTDPVSSSARARPRPRSATGG